MRKGDTGALSREKVKVQDLSAVVLFLAGKVGANCDCDFACLMTHSALIRTVFFSLSLFILSYSCSSSLLLSKKRPEIVASLSPPYHPPTAVMVDTGADLDVTSFLLLLQLLFFFVFAAFVSAASSIAVFVSNVSLVALVAFSVVAVLVSAASYILVVAAVVVYIAAFVAVLVFAVVAALAAAPDASGAAVGHPVAQDELQPFVFSLWHPSSPQGHVRLFLFYHFCYCCCWARLWGRVLRNALDICHVARQD